MGSPCLANVPYSYDVRYSRKALIGSGFLRSTRTVIDPRVGEHVMAIRGTPLAGCTTTRGLIFRVRSFVDAPDADISNPDCTTSDGECTLRAAVMQSNALPGHERIELRGGMYLLSVDGNEAADAADDSIGDLDITDGVTIIGLNDSVVIDAGRNFRIFDVHTAVVSERPSEGPRNYVVQLTQLALTNGQENGAPGGAIWNRGELRLSRVRVEGNSVRSGTSTCGANSRQVMCNRGGGIFNQGELYIGESVLRSNGTFGGNVSGQGGALSNHGPDAVAIIERSLIQNNKARFMSGIQNYLGRLDIINSTFVDNLGHLYGLIQNLGGTTLVRNATIGRNPTDGEADVVPIFGNSSVGDPPGTFRVENTLVFATRDRSLCDGAITSGGYNVVEDQDGLANGCRLQGNLAVSDAYDSTLIYSRLFDNGGPTETIALSPTFEYLDFGALVYPSVDQRGQPRPIDSDADEDNNDCDPGAFEHNL